MHKICSSNPPVVTGICDPNKSQAQHHRSLKLGLKLKYLNIKKGYNEKMLRKWVLQARENSRDGLLEKVKSESDQKKLIFNITYYLFF